MEKSSSPRRTGLLRGGKSEGEGYLSGGAESSKEDGDDGLAI